MALVSRCCCFDLRSGAIILGWLGLVGNIGCLITGITLTQYGNFIIDVNPHYSRQELFDSEVYKLGRNDRMMVTYVMKSLAYSMISGGVIGILMDVTLIYGTVNNKRLLLLPWLISRGISLLVMGLVVLIVGLLLMIQNTAEIGVLIYAIGLPITALHLYFWICVQSLYKKINEEETFNMRPINEQNAFQRLTPYNYA